MVDLIGRPREVVEIYYLLDCRVPKRVLVGEGHPIHFEDGNSVIVQPHGVTIMFPRKHALVEACGAMKVSYYCRIYPGPWTNVVGEVYNY